MRLSVRRTFHDVDERAHVALLDDETVAGVLYIR